MISLLTFSDGPAWQSLLDRFPQHDPHQSLGYHLACEIGEGGAAVLVVAQVAGDVAAVPLLIQAVPGAAGVTHATSAYGYPGLLATSGSPGLSDELHRAVQALAEELGVVTVSVRLNPFLDARDLLADWMGVRPVGSTLAVDLTRPEDEIWQAARSNHRQPYRQTDRLYQPELIVDFHAVHLRDFIQLYDSTMRRKGAAPVYRFPPDYYATLVGQCAAASVFHARVDGEIVSSAILLDSGRIVHYHLAGTRDGWETRGVGRWLIEQVRRYYTQQGRSILHLGGGLGGRRDSLFAFKAGFGAESVEVERAQSVLRPQTYAALCHELAGEQTSAFPAFPMGPFPRRAPTPLPAATHPSSEAAS